MELRKGLPSYADQIAQKARECFGGLLLGNGKLGRMTRSNGTITY